MKKKIIIIFSAIILIAIVCGYKWDTLKVFYLITFSQDGFIVHRNPKGQLDGEFIVYQHGRKMIICNYTDGKRNGPEINFYPNGIIKAKAFYINDKLFGSQYIFGDSGKILNYESFDVTGQPFFALHYNELGQLIEKDIEGRAVSLNIYTIRLNDNSIHIFYSSHEPPSENIRDLYLTTAAPPNFTNVCIITIDGRVYNNNKIVNCLVKIPNVFLQKHKTYHITINERLYSNSYKGNIGFNMDFQVHTI